MDVQSFSGRAACVANDLGPGAEILWALAAHRLSVDEDILLPSRSQSQTATRRREATSSSLPPTRRSSQRKACSIILTARRVIGLGRILQILANRVGRNGDTQSVTCRDRYVTSDQAKYCTRSKVVLNALHKTRSKSGIRNPSWVCFQSV